VVYQDALVGQEGSESVANGALAGRKAAARAPKRRFCQGCPSVPLAGKVQRTFCCLP